MPSWKQGLHSHFLSYETKVFFKSYLRISEILNISKQTCTCILFDRKSKLAIKNSNKISIYYKEESSCCLASRWEKIGNRLSSLWLPWVWCKCACGVLYPIWKCSEMKLKLKSLLCRNVLNDITAALFLVFFSADSCKKTPKTVQLWHQWGRSCVVTILALILFVCCGSWNLNREKIKVHF